VLSSNNINEVADYSFFFYLTLDTFENHFIKITFPKNIFTIANN